MTNMLKLIFGFGAISAVNGARIGAKFGKHNNKPVITYDDSMMDQLYENDDYNYDDYYKDPEVDSYYYYDENMIPIDKNVQPYVKIPSSFKSDIEDQLLAKLTSYEKANLEKQTMNLSENISSFSDDLVFRFDVLHRQMGKRRAKNSSEMSRF